MDARHGKGLSIEAMSAFGAIDIDARTTPFDAQIAALGTCLEGVGLDGKNGSVGGHEYAHRALDDLFELFRADFIDDPKHEAIV